MPNTASSRLRKRGRSSRWTSHEAGPRACRLRSYLGNRDHLSHRRAAPRAPRSSGRAIARGSWIRPVLAAGARRSRKPPGAYLQAQQKAAGGRLAVRLRAGDGHRVDLRRLARFARIRFRRGRSCLKTEGSVVPVYASLGQPTPPAPRVGPLKSPPRSMRPHEPGLRAVRRRRRIRAKKFLVLTRAYAGVVSAIHPESAITVPWKASTMTASCCSS